MTSNGTFRWLLVRFVWFSLMIFVSSIIRHLLSLFAEWHKLLHRSFPFVCILTARLSYRCAHLLTLHCVTEIIGELSKLEHFLGISQAQLWLCRRCVGISCSKRVCFLHRLLCSHSACPHFPASVYSPVELCWGRRGGGGGGGGGGHFFRDNEVLYTHKHIVVGSLLSLKTVRQGTGSSTTTCQYTVRAQLNSEWSTIYLQTFVFLFVFPN